MVKFTLTTAVLSLASLQFVHAADMKEPIKPVGKPSLTQAATKEATLQKPLEITDKKTATKYFKGDTLKAVQALDFEKVKVVAFFWRGSGGDHLSYAVLESHPEQIHFSIKRGMTRDLRSHAKVFILRKDVSYMAPK